MIHLVYINPEIYFSHPKSHHISVPGSAFCASFPESNPEDTHPDTAPKDPNCKYFLPTMSKVWGKPDNAIPLFKKEEKGKQLSSCHRPLETLHFLCQR